MNCLAHAIRFLDRPWFMVGSGLPDWLSMADRSVRLRPKHVDPVAESGEPPAAELALGIQQHWRDDDWFHSTPAFYDVSSRIGRMFHTHFNAGDSFRSGFLGHISMELLIDGVLTARRPGVLDQYYDVVESIDADELQDLVNGFGAKQTDSLVYFLDRYRSVQFIRDYTDDAKLLYRLNRVLSRVRLPDLPAEAAEVIAAGRVLVRHNLEALVGAEIVACVE